MKGPEWFCQVLFRSNRLDNSVVTQKLVRKRLALEKVLKSQEINIRRQMERRNNIHKIWPLEKFLKLASPENPLVVSQGSYKLRQHKPCCRTMATNT